MTTVVPVFMPTDGGGPGAVLGYLLLTGLLVYKSIPRYKLNVVKRGDTFTVKIANSSWGAVVKDIGITTTGVNFLEKKRYYIYPKTYSLSIEEFELTKNTTVEQFRADCKECAVQSEVSVLYNTVFNKYKTRKQVLDWSKCKITEMK